MLNSYLRKLKKHGVVIVGKPYIEHTAIIESGAYIEGNVRILGESIVASGAKICGGTTLDSATIGSGTVVANSIISHAYIGCNSTVGPYAHIHKESVLGDNMRVGNFVEVKNSHIGSGTKMAHLAYIGDADIGDMCNIGCGAIFVNYDGVSKRRSTVGNGVFIGSNSNIVAPVTIEDGAYIAAGSTVTISLPRDVMCIARAREVVKEGRAKYKPYKGVKHE